MAHNCRKVHKGQTCYEHGLHWRTIRSWFKELILASWNIDELQHVTSIMDNSMLPRDKGAVPLDDLSQAEIERFTQGKGAQA